MRVGILALQGGFAAHGRLVRRLGHHAVEVRRASELETCDGLVLPGGESTTQLDLIDRLDMATALERFRDEGKPIVATCAGLILTARCVCPPQRSLRWVDVHVERNAYGRQLQSSEARSDGGRPVVLIRAPRITDVGSPVEVLDSLEGQPITVRDGTVLAATHHPELAGDGWLHEQAFGRSARAERSPTSAARLR